MNLLKAFSRRSFFIVLVFMVLLFIVINGLLWGCFHMGSQMISALGQIPDQPPELTEILQEVTYYKQLAEIYFIPISAGFFFIFTITFWLFLRIANAGLFKRAQKTVAVEKKKRSADVPVDSKKIEKEKMEQDQRLFLYLLSLLQREGRLLDFFSENLDLYEDDQIGAAVRSIHQNCKKVIDKNLSPRPVFEQGEGEEITVEPNFDPNAIKLTGNVSGDPPFRGVLRHKGWQTQKLELPTLSSGQDSKIIAPAEVEIL
jgi:hypothetical protein